MVSAHTYVYPQSTLIDFKLVKVANGDKLGIVFQHQAWIRITVG